jgi:hypothetical protein
MPLFRVWISHRDEPSVAVDEFIIEADFESDAQAEAQERFYSERPESNQTDYEVHSSSAD